MKIVKLWTLDVIDNNEKIGIRLHGSIERTPQKDCSIELHRHEFYEIEYTLSGTGIQIINGIEVPVKRGDVLFFDIGDTHSYYPIKDFVVVNCIFYPDFLEKDIKQKLLDVAKADDSMPYNIIHLTGLEMIEFEEILKKIEYELEHKQMEYMIAVRGYFNLMLASLIRAGLFNKKNHDYKIANIIQYVNTNWNNISLSDLAKQCGYSPAYLSLLFKKSTGMSVTKYINQKRIREAIRLLETTDKTVEDICQEVGYRDKKHFYNLFEQFTGTTPNRLRKSKT